MHHGTILTRHRDHRRCRRGVLDRDRQRGRGRIAVTILDRVGEHVRHATFGSGRITLVAVAAIGIERQRAVLAQHLRASLLHITRNSLHAHHFCAVRAFGVVGHHVALDRGIGAAGHAVGVQHGCGGIIHDHHR